MLRAFLAIFDPPVPPLTDHERDWLLTAAETRRAHQRRQEAIDEAWARVADQSTARLQSATSRAHLAFWQAVEQRQQGRRVRAFRRG